MLIEHYHPVPLPSIDDAKSPQVTPEVSPAQQVVTVNVWWCVGMQVIALYKRVIDVIPDYGKGESCPVSNIRLTLLFPLPL